MSEGFEGRLQTQTYAVDDLVNMVRSGSVRIPSFQRGIRWSRPDVIKLFQSIALGYPIGNLLLWQRAAEAVSGLRIGALTLDSPARDPALFVVDGQQRLTSLASALSREGAEDPVFGLVFDTMATTTRDQFLPHRASAPSTHIPLWVLFDLRELLRWFTAHPELQEDPGLIERANDAAKKIREFRVPVYIVEQSDPDVLRDIFDRMNNYGKQLTRAEVFTALHEAEAGEKQPEDIGDLAGIADRVHARTGFGRLDEDSVFLAILARRGADVSREIRNEFKRDNQEFPGETLQVAQERAEEALVRAILYLQEEGDVPHFAFLPNRYLLILLVRFFAHFPEPEGATRRQLRRWLWRTAARGPEFFKGSSTGALRTLAYRIVPGDPAASVANLVDIVSRDAPPSTPRITEFRTNQATTRILLCAMWVHGPRRIARSGGGAPHGRYTFEDLVEALGESRTALDQVPMLAESRTLPSGARVLAGNRVLLLDPVNVLPESPLDDLTALARQADESNAATILASHCVSPEAAAFLAGGEVEKFIRTRQNAIDDLLADFLASRAEWAFRFESAVDDLIIDDRDDDFEGVDGSMTSA